MFCCDAMTFCALIQATDATPIDDVVSRGLKFAEEKLFVPSAALETRSWFQDSRLTVLARCTLMQTTDAIPTGWT